MPEDVLVLGSINMDIVARAAAIPLPGQTLGGSTLAYFPGGKGANQAVAAARAGARTSLIGCLGDDSFGPELRVFLNDAGVDTQLVRDVDGASGVALIVVADSGENSIVVVPGANGLAAPTDVPAASYAAAAVGVAQFEVPVPSIEQFFRSCRANGVTTVLNTAPAIDTVGDCLALADVLVLNETELAGYAGTELRADAAIEDIVAAARGIQHSDAQTLVVTLGSRGLVAVHAESVIEIAGLSVDVVDTTGAGDCFVGYLAAGLAADVDTQTLASSLERANRAASVCVQRAGAAPSIPLGAEL